MSVTTFRVSRPPQTRSELYELVKLLWGVTIPNTKVCAEHDTPFEAFAQAFFAETPVSVWKGSRGFGGKSHTLATLSNTEAVVLGAQINLLGGSFEQSRNVHVAMREGWAWDLAPKAMLINHGTYQLSLTNGAVVRPLTASQRTVRGPHPSRLRLDEIDEMDIAILDAAMGQPMPKNGVQTNTVMCVVGETLVLTRRGEIPIVEVTKNDHVMTRDGWRAVLATTFSGYAQVIDIVLSTGRVLRCTPDHRIAVQDGWLPASETLGQQLCGLAKFDGSTFPSFVSPVLLSAPHAVASAAFSPLSVWTEIPRGVGMPLGAVGFLGVHSRRGDATQDVLLSRDGLQMIGVAAGSIATQVVEREVSGTDQGEVGQSMDWTAPRLAVEPSVAASGRALPDPAAVVIENGMGQEPVTVVDIVVSHGANLPVYDLTVDGLSEFVAEGIVIHNSSTHQYADGTMTEVLQRAAENNWPVFSWCYKETSNPIDGWLSPETVARKRNEVTAHMFCFPPDQIVLDAQSRPVKIGERPLTVLSGEGHPRSVDRHWMRTGNEEVVRLKVQGLPDEIVVTPNHQILTRDGFKSAGDLQAWCSGWNRDTHSFGSGDMLISPIRSLNAGGNYNLGWFTGLYLAEGSIARNRGHSITFAVSDAEGPEVAQRIEKIATDFAYVHTGPGAAPSMIPSQRSNGRGCTQVRLSHRVLATHLRQEVTGLSLTKEMIILPTQREYAQGVLDGWLYGDGHVIAQGWDGVTYSPALAWQMFTLAQDLGYATGMSRTKNQGLSANDAYHVRISHPSGIKGQVLRLSNGFVARRLRRITRETYSGPLIDLEVEVDHTYLASGVVVHNSVEYDLQEPSIGTRAITTESVEKMFYDPTIESPNMRTGGAIETVVIEEPHKLGDYIIAADWAKEQDFTVISVWRTDADQFKLVAYKRGNRRPWPVMVGWYNEWMTRYHAKGIHDGTGVGNVVNDYIDSRSRPFIMSGRPRANMLTEFIAAVEREEITAQRITSAYTALKYASYEDVYSTESKYHLPDEFCSFALAWYATGRKAKFASPLVLQRLNDDFDESLEVAAHASPWRDIGGRTNHQGFGSFGGTGISATKSSGDDGWDLS